MKWYALLSTFTIIAVFYGWWMYPQLLQASTTPNSHALKGTVVFAKKPPYKYAKIRRVFGVFIGVGTYSRYSGLSKLHHATSDACRMYKTFVKLGKLEPQNARLLLSGKQPCGNQTIYPPSSKLIRHFLGDWLPKKTTWSDRVIIFYSGHGLYRPTRKVFLASAETNIHSINATAISHHELKRLLKGIQAKQQRVFIDACHSGWIPDGAKIGAARNPLEDLIAPGRLIFSSSRGTQRSIELTKERSGLFTFELQQALSGKADHNKDRIVDHLELIRYIMNKVPHLAQTKFKRKQDPVVCGSFSGILPLSWTPL